MAHILIVEDEPRIASFIEKGFKSHGYTTTVAEEADEALSLALSGLFDLLILDLGLPDKDGLEVLEELRGQRAELPVIILTARDDIQDKVIGLEGGADDYMTKPFRFEELLARVRVRLRVVPGSSLTSESLTLMAHNVMLDLRTRKAKVNGQWMELPAREFILAETFFRHPGQVLTRQQLLDRVWGYDYDPGSNIVDVYVGYLRKKLGNSLIETVRGVGYRLTVNGHSKNSWGQSKKWML
ncbi:response regulator transcription factor [Acaryochloris sp. IP29b_bin.148]|uniref:response regulator transcription factor n=1 Tax=Acaryochloris sp. IP29b_bin.148 TaxID=2969218 RepID=UPI00263650A3|nr:response regulator transcription factor [Acaryochloris sp. IP29b_bin.148]